MNRNRTLDDISWALTAIGALNWGLRGTVGVNLVESIFGVDMPLTRLVYGLVGLGGLWSLFHLFTSLSRRAYVARRGLFAVR